MTPALLKNATRAATPLTLAGVTAALGYPAIAAAAGLFALALIAACWIINSNERTERLTRIILARHGNPTCLQASRRPDNSVTAAGHLRSRTRRPRRPAAVRRVP